LKKNGFTLVEIMISIAILSMAVMPFIEVINQNMYLTIEAKKKYKAVYYAKELLEEIKLKNTGANADYDANRYNEKDNIEDYNGYSESIGITSLDNSTTAFDENYYRTVEIKDADVEKYGANVREVTVNCYDRIQIDKNTGTNVTLASINCLYKRLSG